MAKEQAAKADEDDKDAGTPTAEGEGDAAGEGAGEGESAPAKTPLWKKKKFIIIGAVTAVLVLGGAGLYFSGLIGAKKTDAAAADAATEDKHANHDDKDRKLVFYDLGDLLVNLSGEGKRPNFLKLKISIELDEDKDKPLMEQIKPRILDDFQTYLRELRVDDLKGSAGIYRLREELLLRATQAAHPARIRDVLITEMLVQ